MQSQPSTHKLYDSIQMVSPEGTLMSKVSLKRANWYVNRNLAVWLDDTTFKLNFAPKTGTWEPWSVATLENRCVVCGSEENLNKHHVFPLVFKRELPYTAKGRNNYDIFGICTKHHDEYEYHAAGLKLRLRQMYNLVPEKRNDPNVKLHRQITSARNAIERHYKGEIVLPKDVLIAREGIAAQELPAISTWTHDKYEQHTWYAELMKRVVAENRLDEFIVMWRKHFVYHMEPQFLTPEWNINDVSMYRREYVLQP